MVPLSTTSLVADLSSPVRHWLRLFFAWVFCGSSYTILAYLFSRALLFQTSLRTEEWPNVLLWLFAIVTGALAAKFTLKTVGPPPAIIGAVSLVVFFLYLQTSASWIYVDRDPGFLSSGSLAFWDSPLRQLHPLALEGLKWPGFYAVENGTAVQGFPGFYALSSNEVFFTGTFPQFTTQITSALVVFWLGWILCKIGASNLWIAVALQISLATSIPWLYVARNPFTESLAALVFLVGLFAILTYSRTKERPPLWFFGIQLIVVFSVANFTRIDAPVTTVLPLGLMVLTLVLKDKSLQPRSLYLLVTALSFSLVTFMQGRSFSPVYFSDLGRYAYLELVLLLGFTMITLGVSAIPRALGLVRNLLRASLVDVLVRIAPSIILAAPFLRLLTAPEANDKGILIVPLLTLVLYLGIGVGLAFAVGFLYTSSQRGWIFRERGWLLVGSLFVFSTYLQNPLVFGDEPWASRRFEISTVFLVLIFAKIGLDHLHSRLMTLKPSHA